MRRTLVEGELDVVLCYCSVYEECWESRLLDLIGRARGELPPESRPVEDCSTAERSAI